MRRTPSTPVVATRLRRGADLLYVPYETDRDFHQERRRPASARRARQHAGWSPSQHARFQSTRWAGLSPALKAKRENDWGSAISLLDDEVSRHHAVRPLRPAVDSPKLAHTLVQCMVNARPEVPVHRKEFWNGGTHAPVCEPVEQKLESDTCIPSCQRQEVHTSLLEPDPKQRSFEATQKPSEIALKELEQSIRQARVQRQEARIQSRDGHEYHKLVDMQRREDQSWELREQQLEGDTYIPSGQRYEAQTRPWQGDLRQRSSEAIQKLPETGLNELEQNIRQAKVQRHEAHMQIRDGHEYGQNADMQGRELDLQRREAEVQRREAEAQRRDVEIQRQDHELREMRALRDDLRRWEAQLELQEIEIRGREAAINEAWAHMHEQESDLQRRSTQLQAQEAKLAKQEDHFREWEAQLQDQDRTRLQSVQKRQGDVRGRDTDAAQDGTQIIDHERELQRCEAKLHARITEVAVQESKLREREASICRVEDDIHRRLVMLQREEAEMRERLTSHGMLSGTQAHAATADEHEANKDEARR